MTDFVPDLHLPVNYRRSSGTSLQLPSVTGKMFLLSCKRKAKKRWHTRIMKKFYCWHGVTSTSYLCSAVEAQPCRRTVRVGMPSVIVNYIKNTVRVDTTDQRTTYCFLWMTMKWCCELFFWGTAVSIINANFPSRC
jgi:hypothetical protein